MLIQKQVVVEDESTKLNVSKKVSTALSTSLQLLNEQFMACVGDIDTSEVEDVNFINELIGQFNDLIDTMSKNQKNKFKKLRYIKLTDDEGNPVTEYKHWIVGEEYIENGKSSYYNRRIVRARSPKEAIYKYKKTNSLLANSLTCFGIQDKHSDYSLNLEVEDIID